MKTCTDGYPGCRVAEATGKWCAGQCEAMTEPRPSPERAVMAEAHLNQWQGLLPAPCQQQTNQEPA